MTSPLAVARWDLTALAEGIVDEPNARLVIAGAPAGIGTLTFTSPVLLRSTSILSFELGGESTAEFTKIVQSEIGRWGPIVKA